jgi:hypothetical protein
MIIRDRLHISGPQKLPVNIPLCCGLVSKTQGTDKMLIFDNQILPVKNCVDKLLGRTVELSSNLKGRDLHVTFETYL